MKPYSTLTVVDCRGKHYVHTLQGQHYEIMHDEFGIIPGQWRESWEVFMKADDDELLIVEHDDGVEVIQRKFMDEIFAESYTDVLQSMFV